MGQIPSISMITAILGSVFTATSVLFSLYVFWRKKDAEYFNKLRASMIEIQVNLAILNDTVYNRIWRDIGISIANEVRQIDPGIRDDKEAFTRLLRDPKKRKYVVTAIELGVRNSKALRHALSIIERLRTIPFTLESQMPVITRALGTCLDSLSLAAESTYSSEFLGSYLLDNVDELIIKRIDDTESMDMAERELAEIVNDTCKVGITEQIQGRIYSMAERVVGIVTDMVLSKTNSQLRKIRRLSRGMARLPVSQDIEEAFPLLTEIKWSVSLLECIRTKFDTRDWNEIEKIKRFRVEVNDTEPVKG